VSREFRLRHASVLLSVVFASTAIAAERHVSFVACPIMRDTIDVACWLAEYEGQLYYLTKSEDLGAQVYPPQMKHRVLVEGKVAAGEPKQCGGIVLESVQLSVLPELDLSCTTILPGEGYYVPANRYPGPSDPPARRRAEIEAAERAALDGKPVPAPAEIGDATVIDFTFDRDFLYGRTYRPIVAAAQFATKTGAKQIEVIGYRASSLLSNGATLVEREGIAEARARRVAAVLLDAGEIKPELLKVVWDETPAPGNGVDDPSRRRAVIRIHR
jgi:outer membrane protein OmpA-like peptidoglycan-associated protein